MAHWRDNELVKVGLSFESITAHNSAFFLLAVEESRECLRDDMAAEDNSEGDLEEDSSNRSAVSLSPWRDCEVTSIISESEYGGLPKICDPRLGSVWVVSVSYLPSPSSEEGGSQKLSTLNGGDLMLLYRSTLFILQIDDRTLENNTNTLCSHLYTVLNGIIRC